MLQYFLALLLVISPLPAGAAVSIVPGMPTLNASSTNAPAATAPGSISIGDIVTQAQTITTQLETKRGAQP